VDRSRWPQRKLKKIESQFCGPYRILEVRNNSLKVAVSPSIGGVAICNFSQVKHWKTIIDQDEEFLDDKDFQPDDPGSESDSENVVQGSPENEVKNVKEDLPPGYFVVSKILRHKFDQGWKFLTAWGVFQSPPPHGNRRRISRSEETSGIPFSRSIARATTYPSPRDEEEFWWQGTTRIVATFHPKKRMVFPRMSEHEGNLTTARPSSPARVLHAKDENLKGKSGTKPHPTRLALGVEKANHSPTTNHDPIHLILFVETLFFPEMKLNLF